MQDLHTTYLGLKLKNPIIVGSGPLTANLDNLKRCEDSGVGAVVLKSIFEEQIEKEAESVVDENEEYLTHSDAAAFVRGNITEQAVDTYLTLVSNAKKSLSIPVIASINCKSAGRWTEYANRFAKAGADAIEINHYVVAADRNIDGLTVEKEFVNLVHNARKSIKLPLAVKMGMFYSSMPAGEGRPFRMEEIFVNGEIEGAVFLADGQAVEVAEDGCCRFNACVVGEGGEITVKILEIGSSFIRIQADGKQLRSIKRFERERMVHGG